MNNPFKRQTKRDVEMMMAVMDGLIALLDKKGIITRDEIQHEIMLRSENDTEIVGGIEYKL